MKNYYYEKLNSTDLNLIPNTNQQLVNRTNQNSQFTLNKNYLNNFDINYKPNDLDNYFDYQKLNEQNIQLAFDEQDYEGLDWDDDDCECIHVIDETSNNLKRGNNEK
ncbi:hypothetical protein ACW95P_00655 [Candidatus Mycoplasma pogonae]